RKWPVCLYTWLYVAMRSHNAFPVSLLGYGRSSRLAWPQNSLKLLTNNFVPGALVVAGGRRYF
ncbi:MAG: hypothetical protein KDD09_17970, partial [Phaeodactylibacter sp.]|nr:hypothetical protein [Phaeodactylibacter sp.]